MKFPTITRNGEGHQQFEAVSLPTARKLSLQSQIKENKESPEIQVAQNTTPEENLTTSPIIVGPPNLPDLVDNKPKPTINPFSFKNPPTEVQEITAERVRIQEDKRTLEGYRTYEEDIQEKIIALGVSVGDVRPIIGAAALDSAFDIYIKARELFSIGIDGNLPEWRSNFVQNFNLPDSTTVESYDQEILDNLNVKIDAYGIGFLSSDEKRQFLTTQFGPDNFKEMTIDSKQVFFVRIGEKEENRHMVFEPSFMQGLVSNVFSSETGAQLIGEAIILATVKNRTLFNNVFNNPLIYGGAGVSVIGTAGSFEYGTLGDIENAGVNLNYFGILAENFAVNLLGAQVMQTFVRGGKRMLSYAGFNTKKPISLTTFFSDDPADRRLVEHLKGSEDPLDKKLIKSLTGLKALVKEFPNLLTLEHPRGLKNDLQTTAIVKSTSIHPKLQAAYFNRLDKFLTGLEEIYGADVDGSLDIVRTIIIAQKEHVRTLKAQQGILHLDPTFDADTASNIMFLMVKKQHAEIRQQLNLIIKSYYDKLPNIERPTISLDGVVAAVKRGFGNPQEQAQGLTNAATEAVVRNGVASLNSRKNLLTKFTETVNNLTKGMPPSVAEIFRSNAKIIQDKYKKLTGLKETSPELLQEFLADLDEFAKLGNGEFVNANLVVKDFLDTYRRVADGTNQLTSTELDELAVHILTAAGDAEGVNKEIVGAVIGSLSKNQRQIEIDDIARQYALAGNPLQPEDFTALSTAGTNLNTARSGFARIADAQRTLKNIDTEPANIFNSNLVDIMRINLRLISDTTKKESVLFQKAIKRGGGRMILGSSVKQKQAWLEQAARINAEFLEQANQSTGRNKFKAFQISDEIIKAVKGALDLQQSSKQMDNLITTQNAGSTVAFMNQLKNVKVPVDVFEVFIKNLSIETKTISSPILKKALKTIMIGSYLKNTIETLYQTKDTNKRKAAVLTLFDGLQDLVTHPVFKAIFDKKDIERINVMRAILEPFVRLAPGDDLTTQSIKANKTSYKQFYNSISELKDRLISITLANRPISLGKVYAQYLEGTPITDVSATTLTQAFIGGDMTNVLEAVNSILADAVENNSK